MALYPELFKSLSVFDMKSSMIGGVPVVFYQSLKVFVPNIFKCLKKKNSQLLMMPLILILILTPPKKRSTMCGTLNHVSLETTRKWQKSWPVHHYINQLRKLPCNFLTVILK